MPYLYVSNQSVKTKRILCHTQLWWGHFEVHRHIKVIPVVTCISTVRRLKQTARPVRNTNRLNPENNTALQRRPKRPALPSRRGQQSVTWLQSCVTPAWKWRRSSRINISTPPLPSPSSTSHQFMSKCHEQSRSEQLLQSRRILQSVSPTTPNLKCLALPCPLQHPNVYRKVQLGHHNDVRSMIEVCTGMGTAGIPRVRVWMLPEYREDGSDNCGIPAGTDFITAGTPHWTIYII